MGEIPQDDGDDGAVPIDPGGAFPDAVKPSSPGTRRFQVDVVAAVAAGGALGAPARYQVAQLVHASEHGFPWATFWTNVSGSLALGFLLVLVIERYPPSRYVRPFLAVGFLGAFTTFSTFAVETDLLIKNGHSMIGITYAVASVLVGLAAAWTGVALARLVPIGEARPGRGR